MIIIPAVFLLIILVTVVGIVAWFISNKIFGVPLAEAFTNTRMFFQQLSSKVNPAIAPYLKIIITVFLVILFAGIIGIFIKLLPKSP